MKVRWYNIIKTLRAIVRNQEDILRNQRMILADQSLRRAIDKLRVHGVTLTPDMLPHWDGRFEVCTRRIGDLRSKSPSLGIVPFRESRLYRFLVSRDVREFDAYRKDIGEMLGYRPESSGWDQEFLSLAKRMKEEPYDISKCAIVILNGSNVVIDGNHRVAALLAAYGEDYEVQVVKLFG